MDRIMKHAEVEELLGAYAVHALEPDEFASVEAHLADCDSCTAEVERHFEAASAFGMTELEEAPYESSNVWNRISTVVRTEPQDQAQHEPKTGTEAPAHSTIGATDVASVAPILRLDAARESKRADRSKWKIAIGSAVAAVAIAVPITIASIGTSSPSLAALAKSAAKQSGSSTVELLDGKGVRVGDVVMTASGQGYVRAESLPKLADDMTYQLWTLDKGTPVSAGLLGANPKISAFSARLDVDAFAISVEPKTGSAAPTTTPVAVGALT
jgi:anti-sigma-K factor RskA